MKSIEGLRGWRDASLNVLKTFNQNKGMHAIFVSKEMLERDPEFEKSLLNKAQKQQDLVVGVIKLPSASKRTIILLSGCLLARAWAALTATSLLPFVRA
jgi:hypothetical protein